MGFHNFKCLNKISAIVSSVFEDASKGGIDAITLQVEADSYAHNFYKKLGFRDVFRCGVFGKI